MGRFVYSYERMLEELGELKRRFGERVAVREAGRSVLGRGIWEVIVWDGGDECMAREGVSHVLIHAGIHGREYLNCALVMRQTEDFLQKKGEWGKVCFHVLPMVNPDGVEICQRKEKLWKANGRGVDLNRNFDAGWETYTGYNQPGLLGYKGERPESEPEVRAILEIQETYPLKACISYHSAGRIIYWDYGSVGRLGMAERKLAERMAEITGYQMRSTVESRADEAGCSDYFVRKCGIPAVTIETGVGTCPLDEEEFPGIYQENRNVWEGVAMFVKENSLYV